MSKFFVGCRVRKVRGTFNVGMEGVVVGLGSFDPGHLGANGVALGKPSDIQIRYGADWKNHLGHPKPAATIAYGDAVNFEPITPSGHRSGDYSYTELMDRLKAGEVECV